MLREVKGLRGDALRARDGEIGKVDEILFDDLYWTARYLVADTGGWLQGRKVLLAPNALGALEWDKHILNVNLTRDQVEGSPGVETNAPVSRQWEMDYHDYYSWPYYWGGMGLSGSTFYAGPLLAHPIAGDSMSQQVADERERGHLSARDRGDVHLRSTQEVTGYAIVARDGRLGHVEDFIFDDETWKICYLAVATHDWWPGKKVLLPPEWIGEALWPDRSVTVDVTRDQVRNAPEWDPRQPIDLVFQDELSSYYAQQRLDPSESPAQAAEAFAEPEARGR